MSLSEEEKKVAQLSHRAYGIMAEFHNPGDLVIGVRSAVEAGYTYIDTFSPFGMDEVTEILELKEHRWIAGLGLIFGVLGAAMTFGWGAFNTARWYKLNIGGRGFFAWPAYVMPVLDMGIFCSVLAMFIGILWLGRLPRYHHPVFNIDEFSRASVDRFFLLIMANDPRFERDEAAAFMAGLNPLAVYVVPHEAPPEMAGHHR